MRVLIVEDGAVDRLVLEALLRQRGHEPTHVPDGESAWDLLQRESFPLMFTDLRLPGIDGLELLSRVSTLDEQVRPHCVVITASQKHEDLQRALDNGAHDYMFKASGAGALGVRIAIAEQQAQLRERQARGQALQAALYRISEAAHSAESLEDLYESIHGVLSKLMQARNFYIALQDPETRVVSFPFWRDEREEPPAARVGGHGLTEYVLRSGQPLLADRERLQRLAAEEDISPMAEVAPDYWLGVPLRAGRETFGVIGVFSYGESFRIGREEEGVLGFVSEQVAAAIERKRAEAALRRHERMAAMGELVAGVAHEIRNPLFGLSAMIDALEQRSGQALGDVKYLDHIRVQIKRLTALVEDLLEYGKPHEPNLESFSVQNVLRESLAQSLGRAAEREVELVFEESGAEILIKADRKRLVQVFHNLIDNAVQYAPPGTQVRLSAGIDEESGMVRCRVQDAGPGFALEDLARVFEPFFTRRRGGTGLGLSIAQRIVEDHRGRIDARNAEEGGAIVEVMIPSAGSTGRAAASARPGVPS